MRVFASLLAVSAIAAGCVHPIAVYYPNLDTQRVTRVCFRGNDTKLYSANYLLHPVVIPAGTPATVTMFSDLRVNMTVHGAVYSIEPVEVGRFETAESNVRNFLEKYFVDTKEQVGLDAEENQALKPQILSGDYSIGMTKEQIYICLGPPAVIDGTLPAANLSLRQIMASDRWKYAEQLILMVPTWREFVFYENKLQTTNPP